jgi:hypothetical protein
MKVFRCGSIWLSLENEYNAGQLYAYARSVDERLAKWLAPEISFVPWRESARVQVADLLAYEAWKALDHTVGLVKRKRVSWDLLRSTNRFETFSYSEEWYLGLKSHIASGELERRVGFSEKDYLAWLEKTGRKHNTSNLIHFLGTRS